MKRWILIGSIAFVVVVALMAVVLVLVNRSGEDQPAEVIGVTEEWKTIEHPTFGITFSTPIDLGVSVIDDGFGSVVGSLIDGNTVVTLDIYSTEREEGLSAADLLEPGLDWTISETKKGEYSGVRYVGRKLIGEVYDEEEGVDEYALPDSYVVGLKLLNDNSALTAQCSVAGFGYAEYIPVCDWVIDSIKAK